MSLHVGSRMTPGAAKGTDDMSAGQRIVPLLDGVVGKIDGKLVATRKGIACRLNLQHLPFVDVSRFVVLGMKTCRENKAQQ